MKRAILFQAAVLISFSVMTSLSAAEVFDIKSLPFGDTASTTAKDKASGVQLWKNTIQFQKVNYRGKTMFYSEETGAGVYGTDKINKTWTKRSYSVLEKGRLVPYETEAVYKDSGGKVLIKTSVYYEGAKKSVTVVVNGASKSFNFDDDLINNEILSSCLSNYPFGQKDAMQFRLLTPEPVIYKMTVYDRGQETKNGILCQKLEIVPDLGAMNIFGAFVPKMYFWFNAEAPHDFVAYEGLESGLGTPYIVIERTK